MFVDYVHELPILLRARKGKPKCLKFLYILRWLLRTVSVILLFAFFIHGKFEVSGVLAVLVISEFLKLGGKFMLMFSRGYIDGPY